jgi:hypothetical protein
MTKKEFRRLIVARRSQAEAGLFMTSSELAWARDFFPQKREVYRPESASFADARRRLPGIPAWPYVMPTNKGPVPLPGSCFAATGRRSRDTTKWYPRAA